MKSQLCQQLLHNLYAYTLKPEFQHERQMARELFFISTGKVNDDDPFFEQRMACFQEFFLFDYRLSEGFSGSTVFETFLYNAQLTFSINDLNAYEQFRSFKHSIFQVEKLLSEDQLLVTDLLSNNSHTVQALPDYNFSGFGATQFFEGRFLSFENKFYFTGAFILHNKGVQFAIRKSITDFLNGKQFCKAELSVAWKQELDSRQSLLRTITDKKLQIQHGEKKKAIDLLRVTKQIAEMPRTLSSINLVMALGEDIPVSTYVPESPFYDALFIVHQLAYKELKCYRYKHIDPVKIYGSSSDHLDHIQMPKITLKPKLTQAV